MSDSGNGRPLSLGQGPEPNPRDSGTASAQTASTVVSTGGFLPRSQLSQVADCVATEATGLVSVDATFLQNWGSQRLLTSYANEQATTAATLRRDLAQTQEREREAIAKAGDLRTQLAVANHINKSEKKLRGPRTLFSLIGVTVAGFGVDQFVGGNKPLGVALAIVGLAIAGATHWLGPADGEGP